jgi:hypothetical protein
MVGIQYTLVTALYITLKGHMFDILSEGKEELLNGILFPSREFQLTKTKYWS